MAKLYFNTALLLSEILIFVNGQTTPYSTSASISATSSLSNSPTSASTFSYTITQTLSRPSSSLTSNVLVSSSTLTEDLSSTTVAVDPSSHSPSSLISNVLGSSSTLTQDLSSTTVAVDPSSRSSSSFVSDSMSVTSSSSVSLSVSTTSPSSSQTTVTSATVQLPPTSTSTSSSVPPTTQEPSTGQPSTSSPPALTGLSVTIILYVKVDACVQTPGLDALIEANIRVVFARNSELSVKVTLNECDNGAYVKVTIIVRFPVQINFNVATVLRNSLSDNGNKLNDEDALIIDTNRIDVSYTGLTVTFNINDEDCRRKCCNGGVGGPVDIDVSCTAPSPDASCDNIPKTIQEDGHCPNERYGSCSRVCNQAGLIYSPSLAILILLAVASFLKFGFF